MRRIISVLVGLGGLACQRTTDDPAASETVYSEAPPVWFEAHRILANIAPNGNRAALQLRWPLGIRSIDLDQRKEATTNFAAIVDSARNATFVANGNPVVLGWRKGAFAWYTQGKDSVEKLGVPSTAFPHWSSDGKKIAYFEPYARVGEPEHALYAGPLESPLRYAVPGRVTGLAWLPGDRAMLVLVADSLGGSTLLELELMRGTTTVRARALDADPNVSRIAVTSDGRRAFVALSTPDAPLPDDRHRPNADRDLDLYEIDLGTGTKRRVVATPAEEASPAIVGDYLYWTHTAIDMAVVVLPIEGGEPRVVSQGSFLPSWRPDGKAIGFAYGGFLAADWVLNWDGAFIEVDGNAMATSDPQPIISGYHEDFQPVWSPNGRWIAYHSHRSSGPVPLYASPGATDDIYIRGAESISELRLTDYGWEVGSPDWSRDSRRLLFTGWLRPDKGEGRGTYAGIITIDTTSGTALEHRKIPLGPIPSAEMAAWSPASDLVAIESIVRPGLHALWTVRPDGRDSHKLVEYPGHTYGGVDWTPNGDSLLYSAIVAGRPQLFVISALGGMPRQLTQADANILHPQISPDGRFVAATRIVQSKEIRRRRLTQN